MHASKLNFAPQQNQYCTPANSTLHPNKLNIAPQQTQYCTPANSILHASKLNITPQQTQYYTPVNSILHPSKFNIARQQTQYCIPANSIMHPIKLNIVRQQTQYCTQQTQYYTLANSTLHPSKLNIASQQTQYCLGKLFLPGVRRRGSRRVIGGVPAPARGVRPLAWGSRCRASTIFAISRVRGYGGYPMAYMAAHAHVSTKKKKPRKKRYGIRKSWGNQIEFLIFCFKIFDFTLIRHSPMRF